MNRVLCVLEPPRQVAAEGQDRRVVAFVEQLERAGLAIAHGLDEPRVADVLPASLEERRHQRIIGICADAGRPE